MSGRFQVEPQYYSLGGTTEIDPTHIPEFPVSERLRGIEGRNIVGAPWDQLNAQADNARQAEERGLAGGVSWDPLIHSFQRKAHSTVHRAQNIQVQRA